MENLQLLKNNLQNYDWFYDVGINEWGVPTIYVHSMSSKIFQIIFDNSKDLTIDYPCVHFASALTVDASKYVVNLTKPQISLIDDPEPDENLGYSELNLSEEIGNLRKICGVNILSDIFYEIHDGKNAITNLSVKFPEVREGLDKLYSTYGFNLIYEQVDS